MTVLALKPKNYQKNSTRRNFTIRNVRFYPEETQGDESFAKQLAMLGDCYVNDAFEPPIGRMPAPVKLLNFFQIIECVDFLCKKKFKVRKR